MSPSAPPRSATPLDRLFQLAYICAYRLMRVYWTLRNPTTHGALITIWYRGELLLVRNSYVPFYSLPGGYIHVGESARDAAVRELREEVGITAEPERVTLLHEETHPWQGKQDHVQIFTLEVDTRPEVSVDHREVVEAAWWTPERALSLNLFPPLRRAIERRQRELAVTRH